MIEDAIYKILSNIPELSEDLKQKIYPEINPNQDESEFIIYQKISHNRPLLVSGSTSIERANFQIDIYSKSLTDCRAIRENLIPNLHGASNDQYGLNIQTMYVESEHPSHEKETSTFRITITLSTFFI